MLFGIGLLLVGGAGVPVFAAEVVHHDSVGIPGECAVADLLLADAAGLLLSDDALHLLVINALLLNPEELGLQQTLQDLVTALPLGLLLQDALQKHTDLANLGVGWEQVNGLKKQ